MTVLLLQNEWSEKYIPQAHHIVKSHTGIKNTHIKLFIFQNK